jgi:hypothetical protein
MLMSQAALDGSSLLPVYTPGLLSIREIPRSAGVTGTGRCHRIDSNSRSGSAADDYAVSATNVAEPYMMGNSITKQGVGKGFVLN